MDSETVTVREVEVVDHRHADLTDPWFPLPIRLIAYSRRPFVMREIEV